MKIINIVYLLASLGQEKNKKPYKSMETTPRKRNQLQIPNRAPPPKIGAQYLDNRQKTKFLLDEISVKIFCNT